MHYTILINITAKHLQKAAAAYNIHLLFNTVQSLYFG